MNAHFQNVLIAALLFAAAGPGAAADAGRRPVTLLPVLTTMTEQSSEPSGDYFVAANPWGTNTTDRWSLQVGISPVQRDGTIDARFIWSFPKSTVKQDDIWAFPEVVYGVGGGYGGTWPDWNAKKVPAARLPARIRDIDVLVSESSGLTLRGAKGLSQVSYDLWIMRPGKPVVNTKDDGQRLAEIMIPTLPIHGYGVPDYPRAATVGRSGPAAGRMPEPYQGRATIDGVLYDVWRARPLPAEFRPGTAYAVGQTMRKAGGTSGINYICVTAGTTGSNTAFADVKPGQGRLTSGTAVFEPWWNEWGNNWTLIALLPVQWPATPGRHRIDWVKILEHIVARPWGIPADAVVAGIEYGVEPSTGLNGTPADAGLTPDQRGLNGTAGDVTVHGFKVTASVR